MVPEDFNGKKYVFPLAIQTTLPEKYEDPHFAAVLGLLQKYGFSGIELNIVHPEQVDASRLAAYLAQFGLTMTLFATGALAKAEHLSLSHADDGIRRTSIERCREMIDFAKKMKAGVIFGFMKGGPVGDRDKAKALFKDSLRRLEGYAREREVPVLVEATNRYESAVANTVEEAAEMIRDFENPFLRVLPDTYHMNIEEKSMFGTLAKYFRYYDSLHISDNNRFFPGLGAIDFAGLFAFLYAVGYTGGVAIEGNLLWDYERDLQVSMGAISPALSRLRPPGAKP